MNNRDNHRQYRILNVYGSRGGEIEVAIVAEHLKGKPVDFALMTPEAAMRHLVQLAEAIAFSTGAE